MSYVMRLPPSPGRSYARSHLHAGTVWTTPFSHERSACSSIVTIVDSPRPNCAIAASSAAISRSRVFSFVISTLTCTRSYACISNASPATKSTSWFLLPFLNSRRQTEPVRAAGVLLLSALNTAVSSRCPWSDTAAGENAPNIAGSAAYTLDADRVLPASDRLNSETENSR